MDDESLAEWAYKNGESGGRGRGSQRKMLGDEEINNVTQEWQEFTECPANDEKQDR